MSWLATSPLVHFTCCGCCTSVCLTPLNVHSIYYPLAVCVCVCLCWCWWLHKAHKLEKKNTHTHTATLLCTCHSTVSCEKKGKTPLVQRGKRETFPYPPRKTLNKSWVEQNNRGNKHRETTLIYVLKAALKTCSLRAVIVLENGLRRGVGGVDGNSPGNCPGIVLVPVKSKIYVARARR